MRTTAIAVVFSAIVVSLIVSISQPTVATSQPVPSPGLRSVAHDTSLRGAGTIGSRLGLAACGSGMVLQTDGSGVWQCSTGAGSGGGGGGTVTPVLTISQAATTGTPNLTTLGTVDWLANQTSTPSAHPAQYSRRKNGGHLLEVPQWIGLPNNIANNARTQTVTWTASDNLSLGSAGTGLANADLAYDPTLTGYGFTTTVASGTVSRTLGLYVANYNESDGVTCTATMANGEIAAASTTFTMTGIDNRLVQVVFRSAAFTHVAIACVISTNPAGTNLGWLAMWLA